MEYVDVFYPFYYDKLSVVEFDVVIIEGFFPSISQFTSEIRLMFPQILILYYCLDPTYPGMETLLKMSFDGYLVNSERLQNLFEQSFIPSLHLPLAFNPSTFHPSSNNNTTYTNHYMVYVGAGGPMIAHKAYLREMLMEGEELGGLVIYGTGWEQDPHLSHCCWKGILPQEDLPLVYESSKVILSSTIDSQREWGMVNNRVFEGLSMGRRVVSDYSPTLERTFQPLVNSKRLLFYHKKGDLAQIVEEINREEEEEGEESGELDRRLDQMEFMRSHHTYSSRIQSLIPFIHSLRNSKKHHSKVSYKNIGVVYESKYEMEVGVIFQPLFEEFRDQYSIQFSFTPFNESNLNHHYQLKDYFMKGRLSMDGTMVIGDMNGKLDVSIRSLLSIVGELEGVKLSFLLMNILENENLNINSFKSTYQVVFHSYPRLHDSIIQQFPHHHQYLDFSPDYGGNVVYLRMGFARWFSFGGFGDSQVSFVMDQDQTTIIITQLPIPIPFSLHRFQLGFDGSLCVVQVLLEDDEKKKKSVLCVFQKDVDLFLDIDKEVVNENGLLGNGEDVEIQVYLELRGSMYQDGIVTSPPQSFTIHHNAIRNTSILSHMRNNKEDHSKSHHNNKNKFAIGYLEI